MKAIQVFKLAATTVLVAASFQVYAQDASEPAAAAPVEGGAASGACREPRAGSQGSRSPGS